MTLRNIKVPTIKDRSLLMAHLGAFLAVVAWGISFVNTRILLDNGLHPVEIYIYRFSIAYVLLLLFCHSRFRSNSWRDELLFVCCGLLAGSVYFIAENVALEYTLTTNVSLITTTSPLLTMLLIGAFYKSERPSRGMLLGSCIAFLGVGCVIFNSSFVVKVNPIGDLLSLGAALSFAIYSMILRRLNTYYTVTFISRKTFFYGVLTALPFLLVDNDLTPMSTLMRPAVIFNVLFLSIFASLIGFVVWANIVKRIGAVKASNWLYIQPIITLIASAVILNESVTIVGLIGCTMILGGVWLSDFLGKKKTDRSRQSDRSESQA